MKRNTLSSASQREQIFALIHRRPVNGATRKEIESTLGLLHQSVGPRVIELLEEGAVRETNARRDDSRVLVSTRRRRSRR